MYYISEKALEMKLVKIFYVANNNVCGTCITTAAHTRVAVWMKLCTQD